jgi:hypothetical protein
MTITQAGRTQRWPRPVCGGGGGEKQRETGCILKAAQLGFADGLGVRCEKKPGTEGEIQEWKGFCFSK